jgi:SAM-dependent methyltransferase
MNIKEIIIETEKEMKESGFPQPIRAKLAVEVLLGKYEFDNVLDIGGGPGRHKKVFQKFNKRVDTVDGLGKYSPTYLGNFVEIQDSIPNKSYDCIWSSHTLEHEVNVSRFLMAVKKKLKDDGILAITVPPLKHEIVGGHVNLFNLGLLVRNLVAAGFDCSKGFGATYDYDISFIVKKRDINWSQEIITELNLTNSFINEDGTLISDGGDLGKLKNFFPANTPWVPKPPDDLSFNGNLQTLGKLQ